MDRTDDERILKMHANTDEIRALWCRAKILLLLSFARPG